MTELGRLRRYVLILKTRILNPDYVTFEDCSALHQASLMRQLFVGDVLIADCHIGFAVIHLSV